MASFLFALLLATPVAAFAPTSLANTGISSSRSFARGLLLSPLQSTATATSSQNPSPSLEAILFDCDGVLADTERDGHRLAFNIAFKENGIDEEWGEERYGKLLEVGGGKERMTAHWVSYSYIIILLHYLHAPFYYVCINVYSTQPTINTLYIIQE